MGYLPNYNTSTENHTDVRFSIFIDFPGHDDSWQISMHYIGTADLTVESDEEGDYLDYEVKKMWAYPDPDQNTPLASYNPALLENMPVHGSANSALYRKFRQELEIQLWERIRGENDRTVALPTDKENEN